MVFKHRSSLPRKTVLGCSPTNEGSGEEPLSRIYRKLKETGMAPGSSQGCPGSTETLLVTFCKTIFLETDQMLMGIENPDPCSKPILPLLSSEKI